MKGSTFGSRRGSLRPPSSLLAGVLVESPLRVTRKVVFPGQVLSGCQLACRGRRLACACPEAGCRVFPLLQVTGEAGVPGVGRGGFLLRTVTAVRLALSRFSRVV